jgi:hypothetical protein
MVLSFIYHPFISNYRLVILLNFSFIYSIIFFCVKDLLHAQHHSVYIPNYLQAFDYPNADETPSPLQQQEQFDDRFNDGFDPFQFDLFQTSTPPSIQFLLETSTIHVDSTTNISTANVTFPISTSSDSTITTESSSTTFNSTIATTTTEQTTTTQSSTSTHSSIDTTLFNNETSPSNEIIISSSLNNLLSSTSSYSTENALISTHEQINDTIENSFNDNSTLGRFFKNNSELIINLLNRARLHSKNLMNNKQFDIYNTTAEEAARHLSDRKTMQSLIHLIPPSLWSQIQNNFSTINFNQSQYMQPSLPDPVVLAEAAAQAGLPGPGPYPIPDHLWHQSPNFYRNPPQIINNNPITKPTSTCKLIFV